MSDLPARPHVLITAGGTSEAIDDVRTLSNRSTGRLGVALALEAHARGIRVTLVGAAGLADRAERLPEGVRFVPFTDTASLRRALEAHLDPAPDAVWMAAAVADYVPRVHAGKLPSTAEHLVIEAERNDKLLPWIVSRVGGGRVIGFKLLSGVPTARLLEVAEAQRAALGLRATVANDLSQLGEGAHPAWWVEAAGARPILGPRSETASALLDAWHPPDAKRAIVGPGRLRHRAALQDPSGVHPPPRPWTRLALDGADASRPEVVLGDDNALWGLGGAWDVARWQAAGPGALFVHGQVVATRAGSGWRLHTEDTGWIEAHAAALGDLAHLEGPTAGWADRGWVQREDGAWVAPWHRQDARPAASVLVIDVSRGDVLLGMRKKPPLRWSLPGGRGEPDEDAASTALRELREETGLVLCDGASAPRWTFFLGGQPGAPLWRLQVVVVPTLGAGAVTETEELAPAWMSIDAALHLDNLAPTVRHVLRDVIAHRARGGTWDALRQPTA
jgi:ADP-ribose pyrophosphatase YjhB (NUDIX family)